MQQHRQNNYFTVKVPVKALKKYIIAPKLKTTIAIVVDKRSRIKRLMKVVNKMGCPCVMLRYAAPNNVYNRALWFYICGRFTKQNPINIQLKCYHAVVIPLIANKKR